MKVIIFGATGGTGSAAVRQALAAGHRVVAFTRRPAAVTTRHDRLEVATGDVYDTGTLEAPLKGADAVISTLGPGMTRSPTTVYSVGTKNILDAMRMVGVPRFICVSTTGLQAGPGSSLALRMVTRLVLQKMLRNPYNDILRMEDEVRHSGLDWTIVRSARLSDRPGTGAYRSRVGGGLPNAWSLSRADLAHYLVAHLDDAETYRTRVDVGY